MSDDPRSGGSDDGADRDDASGEQTDSARSETSSDHPQGGAETTRSAPEDQAGPDGDDQSLDAARYPDDAEEQLRESGSQPADETGGGHQQVATHDPPDEGESGISRRALLAGGGAAVLGAGAGAYFFTSGGDDSGAGVNGTAADGSTPTPTSTATSKEVDLTHFSVMKEMRSGLRESPDHLPGTAQRLVEEGDPRAIFEFVRDKILTQPPRRDSNEGFATETTGGARGTLRSGMGTPRDKAELLATLLERAGYASEVRKHNRAIDAGRAKELYFDPVDLEYDPGFTEEQRKAWRQKLDIQPPDQSQQATGTPDDGETATAAGTATPGGTPTGDGTGGGSSTERNRKPRVVDADGEASTALAKRIREGFSGDWNPKSATFQWDSGGTSVPVVVFDPEQGSAETTATPGAGTETPTETPTSTPTTTASPTPNSDLKYANLFHTDAVFGTLTEPEKLGEPVETSPQQVTITLEAATADAPEDRMELVSGTWNAAELAGRQVQVETLPGINPIDRPDAQYTDVQKFVPALGVQEPHSDQETLEALSVFGDPFSIVGDRYTVEEDGTVKKNGEVVLQGNGGGGGDGGDGGTTPTPKPVPDTVDQVENLSMDLNVGGYPAVRLKMDPVDGNGNVVEGLPGRAFDVTEDGESVTADLKSNETKPKVGVYYDSSISMEIQGFYETERSKFRKRMKAAIKEANPEAIVEFNNVSSDSWYYMSQAAATTDADVIIYYSDGDGYGGSGTDAQRTAISEGPPAIMMSITGNRYDSAETMAELSDGTHISSNDPADFNQALKEYVSTLDSEIQSYSLTYRSPNEGEPGDERTVSVSIAETDVSAQATYEVPGASIDPRSRRGLTGLYLTVETSTNGRAPSSTTSRRVLAGWDPQAEGDRSPNWADRNEVFSALFGSVVLSFESAGVRPTVFLDDIISGKLSVQSLQKAQQREDVEKFKQLMDQGISITSAYPYEFQQPLPNRVTDRTLTYGTGLRTVMFQRLARFGESTATESIDILSTSSIRTITQTGNREFEFDLTMNRTARYAVYERELYETSTASILEGMDLEPTGRAKNNWSNDTKTRFKMATSRRSMSNDDYRVGTSSKDTPAHWTIDEDTGMMLGVLPDGSGGSESVQRIKEQLRRIKQVTYAMGILIDAAPASAAAGSLGLVVAYQRLLARLYALASIAIATMDASGIRKDALKLIANWVCNLVVGLGFEQVPILSFLDDLNTMDGATDGSTVGCSAITGSPL